MLPRTPKDSALPRSICEGVGGGVGALVEAVEPVVDGTAAPRGWSTLGRWTCYSCSARTSMMPRSWSVRSWSVGRGPLAGADWSLPTGPARRTGRTTALDRSPAVLTSRAVVAAGGHGDDRDDCNDRGATTASGSQRRHGVRRRRFRRIGRIGRTGSGSVGPAVGRTCGAVRRQWRGSRRRRG